ncbi:MAG: AAA family ATPase [Rhodomicrobium sp.]
MLVKAFRLFVSSTFADFAQERDVLQSSVFPALDDYCTAKGYQFYPIDLRWGVSEEAQLDQRTSEICLSEVRAAMGYPPPNFLIMIGNRYGWVPLPYAIARDEFEAIIAWLEGRGQQDAVTVLGHVYRLDDNQLVPCGLSSAEPDRGRLTSAYTLRSRADEVLELKPAEVWTELVAQLLRSLQQAASGLLAAGRIGAAAHERYFLSLTAQEIVHGLPGIDAALPPLPDTDGPSALAFIRVIEGRRTRAMPGYFEEEPRLEALKERIKRTLPGSNIITASATFNKRGGLNQTYLADFAAQIDGKLRAAIDAHIANVQAIEGTPNFALESERAAHRAFAAERLKVFVGRDANLVGITRYLACGSDRPLVLHGRSGLGKSALIARAAAAAEAAGNAPVICRFIGATAASSSLRSLLTSLIDDLAAHGIVSEPAEFEYDANKFNAQIEALLSSVEKPTTIFLDALDQLQKPQGLGWLPFKLSEGLRLVLSVLDDTDYETDSGVYRSLREGLPPETFLEIGPLLLEQGREMLFALEQQARLELRDGQRDYIVGQFEKAGGSPLFLKTAFEIAKSWKSTATTGTGRYMLARDTAGIVAQYIAELTTVHHHKPELVTRTLGYLAAAKDGLSEKEITEVLSRDADVMQAISSEKHGARTDKLPASVWVRFNRDLSPFLVEKLITDQPLLQFFHRQVAKVAHEQHYEPVKSGLHAALAAYFQSSRTAEPNTANAAYPSYLISFILPEARSGLTKFWSRRIGYSRSLPFSAHKPSSEILSNLGTAHYMKHSARRCGSSPVFARAINVSCSHSSTAA